MLHSSDVELCARASVTDLKACADVAIPPDGLYPRPATQQANESACSTLATDSSSLRFLHDDGASATDLKACADVAIPPDGLYSRLATQEANQSACSASAANSSPRSQHFLTVIDPSKLRGETTNQVLNQQRPHLPLKTVAHHWVQNLSIPSAMCNGEGRFIPEIGPLKCETQQRKMKQNLEQTLLARIRNTLHRVLHNFFPPSFALQTCQDHLAN